LRKFKLKAAGLLYIPADNVYLTRECAVAVSDPIFLRRFDAGEFPEVVELAPEASDIAFGCVGCGEGE
jgi:hypothetical protein